MSHEEELRAELRAAVDADAKGIVVDLTQCEFIDSSAIRALLLSREEKSPDGTSESLAVAASSDQILRILSVMGLDQVLPIEPTVDRAAAALSGWVPPPGPRLPAETDARHRRVPGGARSLQRAR